jgi:hypothetical protein
MLITMITEPFVCRTAGDGYWSQHIASVSHHKLVANIGALETLYGELRVYLKTKNWNIKKYGLIYTDQQWEQDLRLALTKLGFSKQAVKTISYSEQGMQSHNYVSLDMDEQAVVEFLRLALR